MQYVLSHFSFMAIGAGSKAPEGIIPPYRPDGEIGRHKRLKISRLNGRTGSIPVPGTNNKSKTIRHSPEYAL